VKAEKAMANTNDAALPAVWVNGLRQPGGGPHVSAHDRGLTLADGVFETMRVRGGTVFRLDRHVARLEHGLAALGIASRPGLRESVLDAVRDTGAREAGVRLTVTRGIGRGGVAVPRDAVPTVIVTVTHPPDFPSAIYQSGLTAWIASGRRNERAMTAGLKTLAYADAVVALLEAERAGAGEALFLDTDGHCSEATSSNLFAWTGSTLLTPPVSCGALPGVTRAAVLEIAATLGMSASERAFGPDELARAAEAFLTSTLRGIAPLTRVGTQAIGTGAPGPVTARFTELYAALVARECRA
jgi:branched-chain amino acid aminotransferase